MEIIRKKIFINFCVGNVGKSVEDQVNGALNDMENHLPNIFLSISTSEYNIKDTKEELEIQAFSDNFKEEDVIIGKDSITARKIKVSEEKIQGRVVYYYVFEREDDKTKYIIEIDTISDEKETEKYIDEFEKMLNSFSFISKEVNEENTEDEVKNNNPNMIYLGSDSNATFTIVYAEKPDDSLNDKGSSEFYNLMKNEVPNLAKSFVIDAN